MVDMQTPIFSSYYKSIRPIDEDQTCVDDKYEYSESENKNESESENE